MVVISAVRSPLIWVTSIATLLITLLITTREPPSRALIGNRTEPRSPRYERVLGGHV